MTSVALQLLDKIAINREAGRFEYWLKVDGARIEVHRTPRACQEAAVARGLGRREGRRFALVDGSVQIRKAPLGSSEYHDLMGLP